MLTKCNKMITYCRRIREVIHVLVYVRRASRLSPTLRVSSWGCHLSAQCTLPPICGQYATIHFAVNLTNFGNLTNIENCASDVLRWFTKNALFLNWKLKAVLLSTSQWLSQVNSIQRVHVIGVVYSLLMPSSCSE